MTLRDAGERYINRKNEIEEMKEEMRFLAQSIKDSICGLCSIRVEMATNILEYLAEYEKQLEKELDINVCDLI